MGEPVLQLRQLGKSFGGLTAVKDVTLEVFPGDRQAVIGPNGAGKTTLFNVACGFVQPDSGRLAWQGSDLVAGAALRSAFGAYVTHDSAADLAGFADFPHAEQLKPVNCAACHTGQVNYKGKAIRIDGGPSMADMPGFLHAMEEAMTQTRETATASRRGRPNPRVSSGTSTPAAAALLAASGPATPSIAPWPNSSFASPFASRRSPAEERNVETSAPPAGIVPMGKPIAVPRSHGRHDRAQSCRVIQERQPPVIGMTCTGPLRSWEPT